MDKNCINCGRALPEEASFCPYCTSSQFGRISVVPPKTWRRKTLWLILIFLLFLIGLYLISFIHIPKTYESGAEFTYSDRDGNYYLVLGEPFYTNEGPPVPADTLEFFTTSSATHETSVFLFAYQNGTQNISDEFLKKLANCSVTASPLDHGATITILNQPAYSTAFPDAALTCPILSSPQCKTNVVTWTLNMKNGDTIILRQHITTKQSTSRTYHHTNTAMDTVEKLQELLDQIGKEESADMIIDIFLPPIIYDGGVTLPLPSCNLHGSSDGKITTTFTDTVTVPAGTQQEPTFNGICFTGSSGTGLVSSGVARVLNCTFTGWDVGAIAHETGWIIVCDSIFRNNRVGLLFNSNFSPSISPNFPRNRFEKNGTALLIRQVPFQGTLAFPLSVFADNEIDIKNPAEHPLDISETIFEP